MELLQGLREPFREQCLTLKYARHPVTSPQAIFSPVSRRLDFLHPDPGMLQEDCVPGLWVSHRDWPEALTLLMCCTKCIRRALGLVNKDVLHQMPKASYQRVNIDSKAELAISLMSGKQKWLLKYQRVSNPGLCPMDKDQKANCPPILITFLKVDPETFK